MTNLADYLKHLVIQQGRTLSEAAAIASEFADSASIAVAVELVKEQIQTIKNMPDPFFLASADRKDWYPGPSDSDRFWPPYRDSLAGKGWLEADTSSLDRASSRILQLMRPPGDDRIRTRGLVVGYIQSGKTASYAATIAKAADVGYRLVIVLAGATNVLRRQTQLRLQDDLVSHRREQWVLLTTESHDFSGGPNAASALTDTTGQRALAVIKKHRGRIASAGEVVLSKCSILVIDDEADQASPNSAKDAQRRTAINEALRTLLSAGNKVAYVGYTATPFANLLIDPSDAEDLYPRDFIVDLPKPSSYFGPEKIFGRAPLSAAEAEDSFDGLDMIREVSPEDIDALRLLNENPESDVSLPTSLQRAVRYFLIATAERHRRGQQTKHSSMLIHTSQSIAAHRNMIGPVQRELDFIASRLDVRDPSLIESLEVLWNDERLRVPDDAEGPSADLSTLLPYLINVLTSARIVVENSMSDNRLDYSIAGQVAVVVGGNVLSRGLTLEGLSVSYFVRTASAYDSLLQMGRWFGYRKGYEDLPRIWMTNELSDYFYDLGTVEAEIRREIARYEADPSITPLTAGVRIRTHPMLAVTAKAKMRAAVMASMSFRARRIQTTILPVADDKLLRDNIDATSTLLTATQLQCGLGWRDAASAWVARGVESRLILKFLEDYSFVPHGEFDNPDLLRRYVKRQSQSGTITNWNVAVASRQTDSYGQIELWPGGTLNMIRRTRLTSRHPAVGASIGALMSERDVLADSPDSLDLEALRGDLLVKRHEILNDTALLLLYPIAPNVPPSRSSKKRDKLVANFPVIGVAVVFPNIPDGEPLAYLTADLSRVPREDTSTLEKLDDDIEDDN
jgi:hypothetical protein